MDLSAVSSAFGAKLLEAMIPAIAAAVGTVGTAVLVLLFKKIGLDVDEKQRAALKNVVRDAVLAVEEQSRSAPVSGAVKQIAAVDIVKQQLPKADDAAINMQIKATLPEVREALGQPALPGLAAKVAAAAQGFGRPKTAEELAAAARRDGGK